jgi:nucleotide-binding universal stress UspA family protein
MRTPPNATTSTTAATRQFSALVALDGSEYETIVLDHALDLLGHRDRVDLHCLTVATPPPGGDVPEDRADRLQTHLRALLLDRLETFLPRGVPEGWRVHLHLRGGDPADEIATLAAEIGADLLVLGRFGSHGQDGSPADEVIRQVSCPTLVVRVADLEDQGGAITCPACVAMRRESQGERWFCDAHSDHSDRLGRVSEMLPRGDLGYGGIGML